MFADNNHSIKLEKKVMKKFNSISLWIEKICDKIIAKFLFKSQSFSSNSKKSPKILSQKKNIIRAQLRKLNWCNKNKAMKREKLITSSGEFAINYFWVLLTQKNLFPRSPIFNFNVDLFLMIFHTWTMLWADETFHCELFLHLNVGTWLRAILINQSNILDLICGNLIIWDYQN